MLNYHHRSWLYQCDVASSGNDQTAFATRSLQTILLHAHIKNIWSIFHNFQLINWMDKLISSRRRIRGFPSYVPFNASVRRFLSSRITYRLTYLSRISRSSELNITCWTDYRDCARMFRSLLLLLTCCCHLATAIKKLRVVSGNHSRGFCAFGNNIPIMRSRDRDTLLFILLFR